MPTYYIHPLLTIGSDQLAEEFFDISIKEMEQHIEVVSLRSETVVLSTEITNEDLIILFNRTDQLYKQTIITFLKEAKEVNASFVSIAISKNNRKPPELISKGQCFDIVEHMRQRCLQGGNIASVALSLSRSVVSIVQPTLSKDRMRIFLSHRRLDGEEIAAVFDREFRTMDGSVFRDLIDIRVGEDAQEIIEKNLRQSDIVVFLDTPKSGESEWIAKELSTALALNIPIVWVKIGDLNGRVPLKVIPADTPHFNFDKINANDKELKKGLVDKIVATAFEHYREYATCVFDQLNTIKNIARKHGANFSKLDKKNMLFKVTVPRNWFQYPQRPMIHIIQCFSRLPKDDEKGRIKPILNKLGYEDHPNHGPYYDTAFLLAPIKDYYSKDTTYVVESFDEYIYNLESYLSGSTPSSATKKGIIISGAFPNCGPDFQQHLIDAVYAITQAILQRQGIVIFGAHPTFQHLIFNMGKQQRPDDFKNAIHLYISKYFVTETLIEDLKSDATVFATENVENSKEKSLTLMRQEMISDEMAVALICLGGKTRAGGHNPGVDEEIELALANKLPVFIIGSAGGRAAELANEYNNGGWNIKLNNLSKEDNKELMNSLDFRTMANKILNALGI